MTKDPFADPFFIPSDQAGMFFHESFENSVGRVAFIAPTFTPGLSHFGIAGVIGREWEFISGPAIIRTDRFWRKLDQFEGYCFSHVVWFDKTDDWSIPTASPDHLIDLVSGKEPA